jgi:hypothetical protein
MSSETSTENEALQPWQLFTLAGLAGATLVVFMSRGQSPAAIILLSLTIFTAAVVGIAAWRTFAPISGTDEPTGSPILGGRTRAALEREKALALRAIKELEFDRAMGKVSDKDFAEMSARLRGRAVGLIRQLDAGEGYRDEIEKALASRLATTSRGAPAPGKVEGAAPSKAAAPAPSRVEGRGSAAQVNGGGSAVQTEVLPPAKDPIPPTRLCSACGTANEADALFCKHCGVTLEPTK